MPINSSYSNHFFLILRIPSMAMEKEQPHKLKILMFPWLAHGHISPFVELAKRLSTRNFTIYLCSSTVNLDSFKASIQKESSSIELVQLHVPSSADLPPHLHTTKALPTNLWPDLFRAFQKSKPSFSEILNSIEPDLLIYDSFQPWSAKLALSRGIPSIHFQIVGATPTSYYHHLYTHGVTGVPFPYPAIYLNNQELANLQDSTPPIEDAEKDCFAFGNFALSSDIVLVSSTRAVEEKYIDYLSVLCKKPIVPTGPLLAADNASDDDEESKQIMKWLSGKKQGSTVYISFGSQCFLSKDQIGEMAKGLQLCDANFIWVIRYPAEQKKTRNLEEELPQGFLEVVEERGIIVSKWAPQAKILAHSSVGGFVSHCGWNSFTESMYFGVPIIGVPMSFEQPLNARLIVELSVGVEVEKGSDGCYAGEAIAKAINKVIECGDLRKRAKDLGVKIKEKEEQEYDEVAEELLRICMKNKEKI